MVLVWSDYFSSLPHQSPIYATFHRVYPRRQWLFKFDTSPDLLNSALARIMFVLFVFPMFRSGFSFNYFSVPVYTSRGKKKHTVCADEGKISALVLLLSTVGNSAHRPIHVIALSGQARPQTPCISDSVGYRMGWILPREQHDRAFGPFLARASFSYHQT